MLACCASHDKPHLPTRSESASGFLTQLGRQQTQRHQCPLRLAVPRNAAIEADTVVELLGVTEDQPRRDTDALLQRANMQFLGVDPPRQAHPKDETARGPGHLRALGEMLLHRQLERAEVFSVFLTDVA